MQKITPFLWFNGQAEEASKYYCSVFKNSKILNLSPGVEGTPGPKFDVMLVKFEIEGQEFIALNGGPEFIFNPAISLAVNCISQQEVDELWDKLSAGGEKQVCGWLKDKYGISWQVIPTVLGELMNDADPEQAQSVMNAVMQMTKLDIAALKEAYNNPRILQH
jgi:predicted 3-demethylubiquinone-9 3-methyltransferase (glyoxalase superfamily)